MKIFVFLSEAMMAIPDSTIVKNGNPVYLPDFDPNITARPYMALRIDRLGKSVSPRFAYRYFEQVAPCLLLTAETELQRLREQGLPWTEAFVFDKSCVLGDFIPLQRWREETITLELHDSNSWKLSLPEERIMYDCIAKASERNTLKIGDLILLPLNSDLQPSPLLPDSLWTINFNSSPLLKLPLR